jgi:hypothetical protein
VPTDPSEAKPARQSRRNFLAKLGLGVAAAAAASLPLGRRGRTAGKPVSGMSQEFPGEDSIFHPAQDPRLDPRRNSST